MSEQLSDNLVKALKILSERLREQNIHWVFAGSVSLALHGVNVTPGDIDIITDKTDACKVNNPPANWGYSVEFFIKSVKSRP